jgi:hypothetical protein
VRLDREETFENRRDVRRRIRYEESLQALGRRSGLLPTEDEPPLGAHLVTPRRGFTHHGIYVGRGKVVHYKSMLRDFCRGPVQEDSLKDFALGRVIWVQTHTAPRFVAEEVARRACSRVGEDRYRLFSNNCEHFCEWCLQNEQRSYQIERLFRLLRWWTATNLLGPCGSRSITH